MENSKKLIGLSLSFCVRDVILGGVKEEDVKMIYCGCSFSNPEKVLNTFKNYTAPYWRERPEEAIALAKRLWNAGKIQCPRNWDVPYEVWRQWGTPTRWLKNSQELCMFIYPRGGARHAWQEAEITHRDSTNLLSAALKEDARFPHDQVWKVPPFFVE